ncbi:MAG: HDOD domain-containing protein [Proteobacteria bacterium]|nr:HDOD domain-containing protein [Pseudomonadota bacterium]
MSESLEEELKHLINRGSIEVPLLPEIANKAVLLAQNSDSDASKMAELIQGDQSLAGHVMRIANSAAYTPMANLVSLQQAIARLGMGVISEIALAASIGAKMFNTPGYEAYVADIWQHALATSLWSKEIARQGRSNVEVAFLAGLLHSIGRPAVLQAILDLAEKHKVTLSESDVHHLEKTHCHQVSVAIVNKWQMPSLVIDAVDAYTDNNSNKVVGDHAAHINIGSRFATHMLTPDKLDKETLLSLPAFSTLNIYQDEVEELLAKTDAIKARLEGMAS